MTDGGRNKNVSTKISAETAAAATKKKMKTLVGWLFELSLNRKIYWCM